MKSTQIRCRYLLVVFLALTFLMSAPYVMLFRLSAFAQNTKEFVRAIPSGLQERKVYDSSKNPEEIQKVRAMLATPHLGSLLSELGGKGLQVDFSAALSTSFQGEEVLTVALINEAGQPLMEANNELILSFLIFSQSDIAILSQVFVEKGSNEARRIAFTGQDGSGIEINYHERKIYKLKASPSSSIHPTGVFGTVGCVIDGLKDLAKPCNASFLAFQFVLCIGAIAALPLTAGISAIVALPECISVLTDLLQALICAGVDCGAFGSGDFAMQATPFTTTINQGGTAVFNVTATFTGGFATPVSLSVSNLHSGANSSFSPTSIGSSGGHSSLIITTGTGTATGTRTLTIIGTGGGKTRTAQVELTVSPSTGGGQGTCANPYNLTSGVAFSGNTSGGQTSFNSYSCTNWNESGPERVHRIVLNSPGTMTVALANHPGGDVDAFVLSSCNPGSCMSEIDESGTVQASLTAGTYYVVVDGYQGAVSSYQLTVTVGGGGGGSGTPHIDNLTALGTPIAGQQFNVRIDGSGFSTNSALVVATGPGCQTFGACAVPNNVIGGKSATQLGTVPLTLGQGTYQIFVQNGSSGTPSNGWLLTVAPASGGGTQTFNGSVGNQQTWTQNFSVPSGRSLLRVTVAWSGSSDLDLHLRTPSGVNYGYLENNPPFYSGDSTNPEVMEFPNPQTGNWQIRVYGFSVSGSGSFTVTVQTQ
jgi:hypothetical protein